LAAMNQSGRLARTLVLGTVPQKSMSARPALVPTVGEPLLYVPTGCGAVLALGVDDLALRWVANYDREAVTEQEEPIFLRATPSAPAERVSISPSGWASNPPVVSGSSVFVAPPDAARLIALDRETGKRRWEIPRGSHRFIVGCDDQYLFLSGRT